MGTDETKQVLEQMLNDAETAAAIGGGDFSEFADADLTDAERALLTAAAGDLDDDVSGFVAGYVKIGDIEGFATGDRGLGGGVGNDNFEDPTVFNKPNVKTAIDYIFKF